ncbi:MAG TPA: YbfB/YjiJ family MFS transporter, partial [Verrucomicrobiae bacterium]|nr:YbfB/YjiJ family MFS transporter [Verrucomicrobiae bacterium]
MQHPATPAKAVAGGFITLLVAMGIGRFAYTPLLPPMMQEYALDSATAGTLASVNFAGYLAGAFLGGSLCRGREKGMVILALLVSAATTAAMGAGSSFLVLAAARLVSGLASAFAFVSGSALVLTVLARHQRENLSGIYFGGVGAGIAFSGVAAPPLAASMGVAGAWVALGAASALLTLPAFLLFETEPAGPPGPVATDPLPRSGRFLRITAAYGLEGFGYIITGTFMVAAARSVFGASGAAAAWVIAGCAAAPSAYFWSKLAKIRGPLPPLAAAHLMQAAGIALPALLPGKTSVIIGAILFGATFMGIVMLALSAGTACQPAARGRIIGLMTGIYGIGQIAGPLLAGLIAARTGSFDPALLVA